MEAVSALFSLLIWVGLFYGAYRLFVARRKTGSRSMGGTSRSTVRPRSSSPSGPVTTRPTASPDRFPGLDAEMRERVRQRELAEQVAKRTPPLPIAPPADQAGVPDTLPVKTKQWFFSRSESAFFKELEAALPPGYRVFPNVRLNDLFLIQPGAQQRATYARLRDKHVDFLIVRTEDFRPYLAIELDGASHDQAQQQYRDAVKDVVFRSAGLTLLRLRAEPNYRQQELALMLAPYFSGAAVRPVA